MNEKQRPHTPSNNLYTQMASYMTRHVTLQYHGFDGEAIEHSLRVKYITSFGIAGKTREGEHLLLPWTSVIAVRSRPDGA